MARSAGRFGQGLIVLGVSMGLSATTALGMLRIVTYNIDSADQGNDNNITASYAGLPTVIQGIGAHHIGSNAQPIDVFSVTETNTTTLPNLVAKMNAIYGAGTYAYVNISDPATTANYDGLIYNTKTVQVLSSVVIGKASGSGAARAPLRYEFQPLGYGADADFYVYVDHYKADSDSTSANRRNIEATEVRQDADALGPNAHIIYTGDFNLTSGSNEASYQTLTAAGNGRAYDPVSASYVSSWVSSSNTWKYLYSISTTSLHGRYDLELVSAPVLTQPGLQLAPDTSDPYTGNFPSSRYQYAYEVFGNNGTTTLNGPTNGSGNTSLNDLPNASAVRNALMQFDTSGNFVGSDHLPTVADYNLVGINPLWLAWNGGIGNWSDAHGWHAGVVPNYSGTEARIDNSNSGTASNVTLDQNATVSDLILNLNDTLSISSGKTLTLSGPAASILSGTVNNSGTLSSNALISNTGTFMQDSGGTLAMSGSFTNTGNATLDGTQQWAPGAVLNNNSGTTVFNSDAGSASSYTLTVNAGGGSVAFVSSQHLLALNLSGIGQGHIVTLYTPVTLEVKSLSISGSAALDIGGNMLVVDYSGSSPLNSIRDDLKNKSIFSSIAKADTQHRLGIAYIDDGSSITAEVKYLGDANMDGVVNADDYALIDRSFAKQLASAYWTDGDFNYDGIVNGADYLLMDQVFLHQGGALSPELLAEREAEFGPDYASQLMGAVPEPVGMTALAACVGLLVRRRRWD